MLLTQMPSTKQRILHSKTYTHKYTSSNNIIDACTEVNSANVCNEAGRTPLHWACAMGYRQLVSLLVEAGALVNVSDLDGASPLHAAVAVGHAEIVKYVKRERGGRDCSATNGRVFTNNE